MPDLDLIKQAEQGVRGGSPGAGRAIPSAGPGLYQPPSMPIAWPVTKAAWSEARNAIIAATSSGVPKRPTGIALARSAKPISRSSPYSRRLVLIALEVRIGPGHTALTVM